MMKLLFIVIFPCAIGISVAATSEKLKVFTGLRRNGHKLSTGSVENSLIYDELILCISSCSTTAGCKTISWNRESKNCLLGSVDVTGDPFAFRYLTRDSNWNSYSLKEFTVFVAKYQSSSGGITFNQSYQLCYDYETVLAGPEDLMYSTSLGYTYVRCTWLSNGKAGYVSRKRFKSCNEHNRPWALCILN